MKIKDLIGKFIFLKDDSNDKFICGKSKHLSKLWFVRYAFSLNDTETIEYSCVHFEHKFLKLGQKRHRKEIYNSKDFLKNVEIIDNNIVYISISEYNKNKLNYFLHLYQKSIQNLKEIKIKASKSDKFKYFLYYNSRVSRYNYFKDENDKVTKISFMNGFYNFLSSEMENKIFLKEISKIYLHPTLYSESTDISKSINFLEKINDTVLINHKKYFDISKEANKNFYKSSILK